MDLLPVPFIVTEQLAVVREFLERSGPRHSLLIGHAGSGKTVALQYLASSLRAAKYLVVIVQLRDIDSGRQLIVEIARAVMAATPDKTEAADDPLDQLRAEFEQFTSSQRIIRAAELLERMIQLVMQRGGLNAGAYILLDGLDEASRVGDILVAVETLATRLGSTSLVVTSRESPVVDRLSSRTAFDTFTLGPLTQAETAQFVRASLPDRSLAQSTVQQLFEIAHGQPFLLSALTAYVREHGDLLALTETDVFDALFRHIYQKLGSDQTSGDARLLLNLLVFFQPVSTDYLTQISGLPAERARAALLKLSGMTLVSSTPRRISFAYKLIAEYHLERNILFHDIDVGAFQFGDEAAERDGLLRENFMPPRDLDLVRAGVKTIVLGDRGAGKSALFRALKELNGREEGLPAQPHAIVSLSPDPVSFVQQMSAAESFTSSADGFKAVWLLYCAALAARDIELPHDTRSHLSNAFIKDSRALLRRVGWDSSIKNESRTSRMTAAARSWIPEKMSLKLGPITVEPHLNRRGRGWFGTEFAIDEFIDRSDDVLQATGRRLLIAFDRIDEAFKYQREKQEALVQGLFLAESFLSLHNAIRLIVLLRTDLFELYDIQEKNKFVSRTVHLAWRPEELKRQLLQRLFSNADLSAIMRALNASTVQSSVLDQIKLQIVFPVQVEGKDFEEWFFENLKNGKDHVAPRQIILFLNLAKESIKADACRRRIPLFSEKEVADAMTRLSELSYQEVISDFRAATAFVRNCRAGKIMEFELERVKNLFDETEGSVALQLDQLERLGFVARVIVKDADSLVARLRIPRLFTRCWQSSD